MKQTPALLWQSKIQPSALCSAHGLSCFCFVDGHTVGQISFKKIELTHTQAHADRLPCERSKSSLRSASARSFWFIFAFACGIEDANAGILCYTVECIHRWRLVTLATMTATNTAKAYLRWTKTPFYIKSDSPKSSWPSEVPGPENHVRSFETPWWTPILGSVETEPISMVSWWLALRGLLSTSISWSENCRWDTSMSWCSPCEIRYGENTSRDTLMHFCGYTILVYVHL